MPKFVLVYHGGQQPRSHGEAAEQRKRYTEWMETVGAIWVSPGNPFGPSKLVTASGVRDVPPGEALSGYSILEADNLEAAVEIARSCPFLEVGDLEVAQLKEMTPSQA